VVARARQIRARSSRARARARDVLARAVPRGARGAPRVGRRGREAKVWRPRRPLVARLVVGRGAQVVRRRLAAVGCVKGVPDVDGHVEVAVDELAAPHARGVVAAQKPAHLDPRAERPRRIVRRPSFRGPT